MNNKQKYLKYKQKYLKLKEQIGSALSSNETIIINNHIYSFDTVWNYYKKNNTLNNLSINEIPNEAVLIDELKHKYYKNINMVGAYYLDLNVTNIKNYLETTGKEPIYTINGHGCTTSEKLRIPKNCQYVTYAICGDVALYDEAMVKFINDFCNYPDIFTNPKDNIFQLRKLYGINIHIHYYEDPEIEESCKNTYMNSLYYPDIIYTYNKEGNKTDNKKKIYKIKSHLSGLIIAGTGCEDTITGTVSKYRHFNKSEINIMYQHSFYPTMNNIEQSLTNHDFILPDNKKWFYNIGNTFTIDQKTLFELLPGTYYNIVCRPPCYNNIKTIIEKRRTDSISCIQNILIEYYETPLHEFIKSTNLTNIDEINNYINNYNETNERKINMKEINIRDNDGYTALHYACKKNINLVNFLLNYNPELNYKNKNGNTPLHSACKNKKIDIVNLLISQRTINLNSVNNNLKTPRQLIEELRIKGYNIVR